MCHTIQQLNLAIMNVTLHGCNMRLHGLIFNIINIYIHLYIYIEVIEYLQARIETCIPFW